MNRPLTDITTDDAALFAACVGAPAVVVAMPEEAAPLLARAGDHASSPWPIGRARVSAVQLAGAPALVVCTGIGLVNAASGLTAVLERFEPTAVLCGGSAGGLHADVSVGDLIVGTRFRYADADATAFGYAPGQVPGMPEDYAADEWLLALAEKLPEPAGARVRRGPMLAGGSFVTAANVGEIRQRFPDALSTDMETTALAQVCANHGVPFAAVRSVSDLCGPAAGQQFHLELELVAEHSAAAVCHVLEGLASQPRS